MCLKKLAWHTDPCWSSCFWPLARSLGSSLVCFWDALPVTSLLASRVPALTVRVDLLGSQPAPLRNLVFLCRDGLGHILQGRIPHLSSMERMTPPSPVTFLPKTVFEALVVDAQTCSPGESGCLQRRLSAPGSSTHLASVGTLFPDFPGGCLLGKKVSCVSSAGREDSAHAPSGPSPRASSF